MNQKSSPMADLRFFDLLIKGKYNKKNIKKGRAKEKKMASNRESSEQKKSYLFGLRQRRKRGSL
jgi:hypothetical protein